MAMKRTDYKLARSKMKPGDVIAFGGKGDFSQIIKWATRAAVSHVGVILQSRLLIGGNPANGFFNQVIESTSLNGFSGVAISRLSDRLATYPGEIWWLPLADGVRAAMDEQAFYNFLIHQDRKPYDVPQAVRSALDAFDALPGIGAATHNSEDFSRFFCSELVAAGLEAGSAVPGLNASEVTPIDLCMFKIYQDDYFQLKGAEDINISGHNTLAPADWGQ